MSGWFLRRLTVAPCAKPKLRRQRGEEGYVLIVLLAFAAILFIVSTQALRYLAFEGQRDKEEELIFRGLQYQHAIQVFYRKFGRYPTSVDELIQTNNVRFLRKKYKDPMTKDGEWRLIHVGPNGALMGSLTNPFQVAATGMTGLSGATGTSGASGSTGASGTAGSGFTPLGAFGAGPNGSVSGSNGSPAPVQGQSPYSQPGGALLNTQRSGQQESSSGQPNDPNAQNANGAFGAGGNSSGTTSSSSFSTPQSITPSASQPLLGQAIGGPIAGFASQSKQESIRIFNKYQEYDKWEFIFDPRQLQGGTTAGLQTAPGIQQNQLNQSGTGSATGQSGLNSGNNSNNNSNSNSFGSGGSSSGFGGGSSFGGGSGSGSGFGSGNTSGSFGSTRP